MPAKPTSPPAASDALRQKIELVLPYARGASRSFVEDPRVAELYPEYLFMVHSVIRASVPLMEAARGQAERAAGDEVATQLAAYLDHHIPEELDHDDWLLDDLEVLGQARTTVLGRPPSATIAALVGAQYYWIFHYHPVILLAYIALLEGYPPSTESLEELMAKTGHPREAFRTLLAHAELDPGHTEELDELLDELPLTEEQSVAIGLNAMYSGYLLARAFDELLDAVPDLPRSEAL